MSLLRTIMEHSTLSLSGSNTNSSGANGTESSSSNGNNTMNSVTTTTAVSNPTVTPSASSSPADQVISAIPQTSNNTIGNNGPTVSAELIAIRNSKEQQRRRERRERRIRRQRRGTNGLLPMPTPEQLQHYYHHNLAYGGGTFDPYSINAIYGSNGEYGFNCNTTGMNMPDILNSHIPTGSAQPPPPYSTLPGSGQRASVSSRMPQSVVHRPPHVNSPSRGPRGWRHAIFPANRTANDRRSQPLFLGGGYEDETGGGGLGRLDKSCCGVTVTQTVSIRWFIVMIAFVGICCSVVGTVLGAMKASGREHLTVSLLMIGVGIVLITVSGIAWRLTSTDAPSCRAMLGLGGGIDGDDCNGRFLTRPNAMAAAAAAVNYGRPQHPYAAMMYSDFNYRPPPPSYQASMQEYRLRLLLLDRGHQNHNTLNGNSATTLENSRTISGNNDRAQQQMLQQQSNGAIHTSAISQPQTQGNNPTIGNLSPPPAYRSHLRSAMANAIVHSRPPSYRSHQSDHEVVVPQTNASNTLNNPTISQRDQLQTSSGSSQVLSTTAQINHEVENNQNENISNLNTSNDSSHEMPSKLNGHDASLCEYQGSRDKLLVSKLDQTSFKPEEFSQSSSHLQNISSVACLTGSSTLSQQHEAYEQPKKENKSVNVVVSLTSLSNSTENNADSTTPSSEQIGEKHKICDKTLVPSHLDEAFEVTHSAAELMKSYNFQTTSSDVWQLLPTSNSTTLMENQSQPKSLPAINQTSHYVSPTHLQQYTHPAALTTGRRSSAGRKIVNLFNSHRNAEGVSDNAVVNVSMDSSSTSSNTGSATSSYSAVSSSKRGKKNKDKKENNYNNHSSLVTIIHHQRSSSDNEESDCEQSSIAYSRLGSERDVCIGQGSKQTSEGHFPSSHSQLNHQSDIVTVSSGLSKRHRDDNYQILSVAGMPSIPLDRQNNAVPEKRINDSQKEDSTEQAKTSPPGQQVEFLAHL